MLVLSQPFDADGGVCRNDIVDLSFNSCPVLLNTPSYDYMYTAYTCTHIHKITHHRPVQDAGPVTMKLHGD